MSDRKFKVWLDSGANHCSCYEEVVKLSDLGLTSEEWDKMEEGEREALMRDIAFERSDWGYAEIE